MGQGPSTTSGAGERKIRQLPPPSRLHYAVLTAPNGVKVHVVGVYPCSTVSEDEATSIITSTKPEAVYVDVHPEIMAFLTSEVKAGRVSQYVPSEVPQRFHKFEGAGWISSIKVRQLIADNEMFKLIGAEMFGPYKAAIAAALQLDKPATLISFPMQMDYNNGENMERPSHVVATLVGNASMNSDTVFATLGSQIKMLTTSTGDLTFPVALPKDTMYFTRATVAALQDRFRAAVNAVARKSSAEAMDTEAECDTFEAKAREMGDTATAQALHDYSRRAQNQTQAIVGTLHAVAASLPPDSNMVAVVNLGAMASLSRNWSEGKNYAELFPPLSPIAQAAVYGSQTLLLGGLGYGLYRVGRRFPKTTIGVGTVIAGAAFMTAYGMIYAETMMYGQTVRSALAHPRVSSSIARVNSK